MLESYSSMVRACRVSAYNHRPSSRLPQDSKRGHSGRRPHLSPLGRSVNWQGVQVHFQETQTAGETGWGELLRGLNGPDVLSRPRMASIWSGLLGREIRYSGDDMDAFDEPMRKKAPSWSAFDIRLMFQGYLEPGFVAEAGDTVVSLRRGLC
jgi:hypothetical protein